MKQSLVHGKKALLQLAKDRRMNNLVVSDYEIAFALGKTNKPFEELSCVEVSEIYDFGHKQRQLLGIA